MQQSTARMFNASWVTNSNLEEHTVDSKRVISRDAIDTRTGAFTLCTRLSMMVFC